MMYKCVQGFSIDKYDEHEMPMDDDVIFVERGSIWEESEYDKPSMSEHRLKREGQWLEISEERLNAQFIKLEKGASE